MTSIASGSPRPEFIKPDPQVLGVDKPNTPKGVAKAVTPATTDNGKGEASPSSTSEVRIPKEGSSPTFLKFLDGDFSSELKDLMTQKWSQGSDSIKSDSKTKGPMSNIGKEIGEIIPNSVKKGDISNEKSTGPKNMIPNSKGDSSSKKIDKGQMNPNGKGEMFKLPEGYKKGDSLSNEKPTGPKNMIQKDKGQMNPNGKGEMFKLPEGFKKGDSLSNEKPTGPKNMMPSESTPQATEEE